MVDSNKMTDKEALSWLMQPGIKATLYGHDRNTNGALMKAIAALIQKVEEEEYDSKDELKESVKVFGKADEYFCAYTKNGTRISSGCYDWCCMKTEITNYMEQENISENAAYIKFWNAVREYDTEKYDNIIKKYDCLDDAVGDGSLDELRLDYIESLYEFVGEE